MFKKLHIYQQINFIFVIWLSIGAISEAFAYRQVMAGPRQACAIKNNGAAVCWGQVKQTFSEHTFTQIFAGYYGRTIGLKTNGSIINLGNLYSGWNATELPTQENFTQFGASWNGGTICGLKTDGTIKCFGDDTWGLASPPDGIFTQLSMGGGKACGLKIDGTVTCWGQSLANTPAGVLFTKISAGENHMCGLRAGDGSAICWGANDYGQSTPPKDSFAQIATGSYHTCGLKSNGMAMCWGDNGYGQSTPPLEDTFIQISAGNGFSCGVKGDGNILCWGTGKNIPIPPPYDIDPSGNRVNNDYGQALPPIEESLTQPQLDAAKQAGIEEGISQTKASFGAELNTAKRAGIQEGINQCKAQQIFGGGTATQKSYPTYDPVKGEVHIPLIGVPNVSGVMQTYDVYLLQKNNSFTFDLDLNRINFSQ